MFASLFSIFIILIIFYFHNNLLVSVERTPILLVYNFGILGRVPAAALVQSWAVEFLITLELRLLPKIACW